MEECQLANLKVRKAIDKTSIINDTENKNINMNEIKEKGPKGKLGKAETDIPKNKIDNISPKKVDTEKSEIKRKESSDFEIDVLTESNGLNKVIIITI